MVSPAAAENAHLSVTVLHTHGQMLSMYTVDCIYLRHVNLGCKIHTMSTHFQRLDDPAPVLTPAPQPRYGGAAGSPRAPMSTPEARPRVSISDIMSLFPEHAPPAGGTSSVWGGLSPREQPRSFSGLSESMMPSPEQIERTSVGLCGLGASLVSSFTSGTAASTPTPADPTIKEKLDALK